MTTSELIALKELLNNGLSVEVHEAMFSGNINVYGVKIRAKVKYSGLVEVDGLGDVVEEVIVNIMQADPDVHLKDLLKEKLVDSTEQSTSDETPDNFYKNRFEKRS